MNFPFFHVICAAALAVSLGGCTVLGVETESTTTEVKDTSGLESKIDRLQGRIERLERQLDQHIHK